MRYGRVCISRAFCVYDRSAQGGDRQIVGMVQSSRQFRRKKKIVLISTSRGGDYTAILQQYGMYAMLGLEDIRHILGAGKEAEAKELGASIR